MDNLSPEHAYAIAPYDAQPDTTVANWETDPRNVPMILDQRFSNGQVLKVIGVCHFTEPGNKHHEAVVNEFREFEEATRGQQRVVLVEGGIRTIEATADDAYRKGSESSLLAFLAEQHGIPQDCIEPPNFGINWLVGATFESAELGKVTFTREDAVAWLTAIWGPVWQRRMEALDPSVRESYDEYVVPRLQKEQAELGWHDMDFSGVGLREIYQRQCGQIFNPTNTSLLLRQTLGIPNPPQDRLEAFGRQRYALRHQHLAMGFDFFVREGISVCSTLGTPNVWALEQALKTMRPSGQNQTFLY